MANQLINGEIDLSVGYNVMFSNVLSSYLVVSGVPLFFAVVLTVCISMSIGTLVGLIVSRLGVNSFIASLGAGMVFFGSGLIIHDMAYGMTNAATGYSYLHLPEVFKLLAQGEIGGIRYPIIYAAVAIVVFVFLSAKTQYFRKYFYIGMNKEAAKLSGINVKSMKTVAFMISSGLASFAGVLLAARMGSPATSFGVGMELKAITAVVIGGVSFKGGRGTMGGALLGGLFIFCLSNGLRIAEAPSNLYKIIEGCVLLAAVILDAQFSKRKVIG
jgi:ribose/xylose/arabinose/galactoside ABC-type transport system permease subunit